MCAKSLGNSNPGGYAVSTIKLNPRWNAAAEPRHHIFLFDGTWNDSTGIDPKNHDWDNARQLWISRSDPAITLAPVVTNVVKTHFALAADSATQLTHYFRGVGNDDDHDALNRLTEGAFARYEPSTRHLAYGTLLRHYQAGDRVSLLGFSRGAASARLFARDLSKYGVLSELMIQSRYVRVKNTGEIRQDIRTIWPRSKHEVVSGNDLPIAFLGVWDTVAFAMTRKQEDWALPANVSRAVHCLALDETRVPYEPTLVSCEKPRAASVKEVWFAGAHSDIGGGYRDDALGRLTLDFMWRSWNHAVEADDLPALEWRPELAARYVDLTGATFVRHSEAGDDRRLLLRPRACTSTLTAKPRVHPTVERFVQQGGLFLHRDRPTPPGPTHELVPYQPLAYPGPEAVELYDSTEWA